MITTADLAKEIGINQRSVQNRILRLGLKVQRAGNAFILTEKQANAVRKYRQERNCSNCGVPLTSADYEGNACSQCQTPITKG